MEITPQNLRNLRTTYSGIYRAGYTGAQPWSPKVAMEVPSSTSQNDYGWMQDLPRMREWLGERHIQNLAASSYVIKNKEYELTIGVRRPDIEDDNLGLYNPMMAEMGRQAAKHMDDLIVDVMQGGHAQLTFDGQNFFDTDHPNDPNSQAAGTQQNYWASGKALGAATYAEIRAAMMTYVGANGRPLGITPNLLVVPPQLEAAARVILHADIIAQTVGGNTTTATNVLKGTAELLVVPELANEATAWYLLDTTRAIKPFVFQRRKAPEFVEKTSNNDDNVFHHNKYLYGIDCRDNAGYGLWFLAAKAKA